MPEDILRHAASLLRQGYHHGTALAVTEDGRPCHPADKRAVAWGLHGALLAAASHLDLHRALQGARQHAGDVCWENHRLFLVWADLSPEFGQAEAVACCQ